MAGFDQRFLRQLLATFKEEARERVTAIAAQMVEIERAAPEQRAAIVEAMFREAHSLKAAAAAVNQKEIEVVCQATEHVLAALKRGEVDIAPLIKPLWRASDALNDFLGLVDIEPDASRRARAAELGKALDAALKMARGQPTAIAPVRPPAPAAAAAAPTPVPEAEAAAGAGAPQAPAINMADTMRLPVRKLGALLLQVEETLPEKLSARQLGVALEDASASLAAWRRQWDNLKTSVMRPLQAQRGVQRPPHVEKLAKSLQKMLDWNEQAVSALEEKIADAGKAAVAQARGLTAKVDALHRDMKTLLTLQCSSLLGLFPRVVREIADDQGKTVKLTRDGGELEMDRRILEELKDPLLHIVRNAVDHGIERPDERAAAGKPAEATLAITIRARDNDKIEFTISDDGRGIPTGKLAAAATKAGVLAPGTAAGEADLVNLIFHSGLSTSPIVTDLSGRGLGMAIVREKVEQLGGSVAVETAAGQGTIFRLVVPLTLATYRGIPVAAGGQTFVVPTLNVERVLRANRASAATIENRAVIDIEGVPVSLASLSDVLELSPAAVVRGDHLTALVVGHGGHRIAFEVDAIGGEQEILVKPLGRCLVRVRNVQGATILATGDVAPILNTHDLVLSAAVLARKRIVRRPANDTGMSPAPPERKRILVAEDSITARGLLKAILESSGYDVKTAVDGLEAWEFLKFETFDLLVTDVEMPGMNGFDLTARVRADKTLATLPVVLVTALASREDRERGVDVGANAYIFKGGFERGRLLDAVRRLA